MRKDLISDEHFINFILYDFVYVYIFKDLIYYIYTLYHIYDTFNELLRSVSLGRRLCALRRPGALEERTGQSGHRPGGGVESPGARARHDAGAYLIEYDRKKLNK